MANDWDFLLISMSFDFLRVAKQPRNARAAAVVDRESAVAVGALQALRGFQQRGLRTLASRAAQQGCELRFSRSARFGVL